MKECSIVVVHLPWKLKALIWNAAFLLTLRNIPTVYNLLNQMYYNIILDSKQGETIYKIVKTQFPKGQDQYTE